MPARRPRWTGSWWVLWGINILNPINCVLIIDDLNVKIGKHQDGENSDLKREMKETTFSSQKNRELCKEHVFWEKKTGRGEAQVENKKWNRLYHFQSQT